MPELPDVAYLKTYLDGTSLHQKIDGVELGEARLLQPGLVEEELRGALVGRSLGRSRRHGKYLFAELAPGGGWLALHFGMSGWLDYYLAGGERPRYARMLLRFAGGATLAYISRRMLGTVALVAEPRRLIEAKGLGPDALALDLDGFRALLRGRRGGVKSLLMNQRLLAGLGNVYSDEILFQARIHPRTPAASLGAAAVKRLFGKMRHVLQTAAERKADPSAFPRTWLTPHRRPGAACPRSNGEVRRQKVAGRSAHFCPACQPASP